MAAPIHRDRVPVSPHSGDTRRHPKATVLLMLMSIFFAIVVDAPLAGASAHSSGSWVFFGANPRPGITSFAGVSCPTRSDCWAIGAASGGVGAILATSDARGSWAADTLPSGVTGLDGISCPTSTHCWATGDVSGKPGIISTANGGSTWASQTLPNLPDLTALNGVSCPHGQNSNCWAVGNANIPTEHVFYVLDTTDGGTHWSDETLGGSGGISIECPTSSICIAGTRDNTATEAAVDVTQDGGTEWTQTDFFTSGEVDSISCPNRSYCWIAGVETGPGIPVILESTNGGSTWTTEATLPSDTQFPAISCPTHSDCWAVGSNTSSDAGLMMASTDGGKTWLAGSIPGSVKSVTSVSCAAAYICSGTGASSSGAVMLGTLLEVKTKSLPTAVRGDSYTAQLQAAGGRPTYTWSISSGNLPTGLTLSTAGVVSGTPDSSDSLRTYMFEARVADSTPTSQSAEKSLSILLT
jgi:Putative Ig domain